MKYSDVKDNKNLINLCGHDDFKGMSVHHTNRFNALKPYIKDNMKILDLGCGSSVFFLLLKEFNPTIIPFGIDREKLAIDASKEIFPEHKENFVHEDMVHIKNINFNVDMIMVSAQLLSASKYYYIFDWMLDRGETIIYQHGIFKPFDNLRSIISNYSYNSLSLSNDVVKVISKIERKNILPSLSINKLKDNFDISPYTPDHDFNYLNNMWENFYKNNYQYYEIKKDGVFAVIAADGDNVEDVFVIKLGNLL